MANFLDLVADHLKRLTPYQPARTEGEIKELYAVEELCLLANNENPLQPHQTIKQALLASLNKINRYPEDAAPELKAALATYTGTSTEQITLGCGSSEILDTIARVFLAPGKNLIVSQYGFSLYAILAKTMGVEVITVLAHNYQQDLAGILAAINADTRVIMLANPNNPTGTWHKAQTMFDFIAAVPKHVVVVIDEAYHEYMTDPAYQSVLAVLKQHPNLIITRTFSKAFGLAGLRVGYSVSSSKIADVLNRVRKPFNVTNLSLIAAQTALSIPNLVTEIAQLNAQEHQQLVAFFTAKKIPVISSTGNFLTVEFGSRTAEITEKLLQHGIITRSLLPYQMPQHLRISISTPDDNTQLMRTLDTLI